MRDEEQVPLDRQAKRATDHLKFRDAHRTEFGKALAQIAKAKCDVGSSGSSSVKSQVQAPSGVKSFTTGVESIVSTPSPIASSLSAFCKRTTPPVSLPITRRGAGTADFAVPCALNNVTLHSAVCIGDRRDKRGQPPDRRGLSCGRENEALRMPTETRGSHAGQDMPRQVYT
jgi:hypothetical protein